MPLKDLPFEPWNDCETLLSTEVKLGNYFKDGYRIVYTYDFGDDWKHEIILNKALDDYDKNYPRCLMGEGNAPPEVIEGLKAYLDTAILGYTLPKKAYLEAAGGWMKRRHNWEIQADWIVGSPGVVHAFFTAIRALTEPGDGVIAMTPVYYPFYAAIKRNQRTLVKNPLINTGSTYRIDFEDLEEKAKNPHNKILLFCSNWSTITISYSKRISRKIFRRSRCMFSREPTFSGWTSGNLTFIRMNLKN